MLLFGWLSLQIVCMDLRLRWRGKRGVKHFPVEDAETIAGSCRDTWLRRLGSGAGKTVLSQTEIVHGVTPIAGHSYPASAENCWKADCPGVPNCFLRIMCATSMPSSVAEAERKDLKPFICLVSFLMNLWSCSMMLLRNRGGGGGNFLANSSLSIARRVREFESDGTICQGAARIAPTARGPPGSALRCRIPTFACETH